MLNDRSLKSLSLSLPSVCEQRVSGFILVVCLAIVQLLLSGQVFAAEGWPDFRGPTGDGYVPTSSATERASVPLLWDESKNIPWKTPIPHLGLSSPVVMDGRVWLTTATEDGHEFFVICVEAETGEILANVKLFHSEDPEPLSNGRRDNSYATPSPVVEKDRVYLHFGSFGTACLDTKSFDVVWKRSDMPCQHYRGASSSPVLFDGLVILTFDGADQQYLIGLDKLTGETVWKTDRSANWNDEHIESRMVKEGDWRKAHSTPLVATVGGESRLFSVGAKAAYSYEPASGKELWRVDHEAYSAAPRPILHEGRVVLVTGFSRGAQMMAVRTGGRGVVTDTHVHWKIKSPFPKYSSPIVVDDLIYMALDDSFLVCLEAESGETVWKERVGGKFRAWPVYADGRLYFFSLEGETTVIKPGREFEVLATNRLAESASRDDPRRGPGFMASPAVVGGSFFLRTRYHLYRVAEE